MSGTRAQWAIDFSARAVVPIGYARKKRSQHDQRSRALAVVRSIRSPVASASVPVALIEAETCVTIDDFDIEQEIRLETRKALDRNAAEPFLLKQIEELKRDADRYRWLRSEDAAVAEICNRALDKETGFEFMSGIELDAAIDAAIAELLTPKSIRVQEETK